MLFIKFWGVPNTQILWKNICQHGALKPIIPSLPSSNLQAGNLEANTPKDGRGRIPGVREG